MAGPDRRARGPRLNPAVTVERERRHSVLGHWETGLARSEAEIREYCLDYLRKTLDLPAEEIVPDASFASLGLDSGNSIHFLVGLEEWLGQDLDPEVLYRHATVAALAQHLAAAPG